ncbi:hypothetical protein B0H13DRAFT_1888526 [Mycena leptocephala]|nr:hypothetical protein B0H13DRAFT_1888526 [Mycena leptocephala]
MRKRFLANGFRMASCGLSEVTAAGVMSFPTVPNVSILRMENTGSEERQKWIEQGGWPQITQSKIGTSWRDIEPRGARRTMRVWEIGMSSTVRTGGTLGTEGQGKRLTTATCGTWDIM